MHVVPQEAGTPGCGLRSVMSVFSYCHTATVKQPTRSHRADGKWWLYAAALVVAIVLLLTLWPDSTVNSANFVPLDQHGAALRCLLAGCPTASDSANFLIIDVVGNVVVFVPVGFTLAGAMSARSVTRPFWRAVVAGSLLSLFIETIQFQMATRATDVDDLLFNTLGTAIGAGLLILLQRRPRVDRVQQPDL